MKVPTVGGCSLFVLGFLLAGFAARADDVTTLSGQTLHEVRLTRLEPDGITWTHSTGICKVDFTDLPASVRQQYHYDAAKADAYRAAQLQARQQAAAQADEDQRKLAEWRARRIRRQTATASDGTAGPDTFVYRRDRVSERAEDDVGEQIAARKLAELKRTEYDGTLYDRRLWAIPRFLTGLSSDAHDFDPPDTKSPEYQRGLRRAPDVPGGPNYLSRTWYEDVDRAAAFAGSSPAR